MPTPTALLVTRLQAAADAVISKMLAARQAPATATLSDIERSARFAGREVEQAIAAALAEECAAEWTEPPQCAGCKKKKAKGWRQRALITEAGAVTIAREDFYCPACGLGACPLDERWGLTRSAYSPELQKQMVWAAAGGTYAEASESFTRLAHRTIPATSIWEVTQRTGAQFEATAAAEQAAAPLERVQLPPAGQDHATPKAVSLDGGMVNIRGEGWKEFKTGTVADIVVTPELDPTTHEWGDQAHPVNLTYRAVLGDVAAFSPALWALAVAAEVPTAAHVAITADGAEWIWNLTADLFPDGVQIVDWYHATEYLARAANALYPTDAEAASRWQQAQRHALFLGETYKISAALEQASLATHAGYF